jgi:hypothetical protein
MELGKDMDSSVVDDIIKNQKPNQCASLVYTVSRTMFSVYILQRISGILI